MDDKQKKLGSDQARDTETLTKELNDTQQKLQILLGSIPGGVAIYRIKKSGRVATEYVSEGLATICGYTAADFLAHLREDALMNVVPEDRVRVMAAVSQGLQQGAEISVSYQVYSKERQPIDIRLDANIAAGMAIEADDEAILYAVHTRLPREAQIIRSEQQRYRTILEYLDVAFFEWMPEKGFFSSEKYKRYAISQVDYRLILKNAGPNESVHPDDLPILHRFFEMAKQSVPQAAVTLRCKMTDGSYRWTEMMGFFSYDETGRRTKTVAVLRDVNREWEEQNARLQQALQDAQQANRAKTEFLSSVSHDMRTPLNGIMGLAALMREKTSDQEMLQDLDQMRASGQYLLTLINDTLDVSRIETGKLELHPAVCQGEDILSCILSLADPVAKEKGVSLTAHTEKLRFGMLYTDAGRLEQVFVNILGNAVKFTPKGGSVDFTLTTVGEQDGVLTDRFVIADNGVGMSEEFLPHLFEPFSQERREGAGITQGSGLGMAITKRIIEQMGGEIRVESKVGRGTTFTVLLPLRLATQAQVAASHAAAAADYDETVLHNARVLLCEDHPLNTAIVVRLLTQKGVAVTHAENGKLGVELFRQSPPGFFQAVLMDVRMPVMDGLEATRQIRGLPREDAQRVAIIGLSANAFSQDIAQAKAAGIDAYLSKPFEPESVYRLLVRAMQDEAGWQSETDGQTRPQINI